MPEEKPLQKEIDELLKAMAAVTPPPQAPTETPTGARRAEAARGPVATLELLKDVALNVRIELGRARMSVEDVLRLGAGAVVELDRLAGEPVDVYVNERLAARGELLVVEDQIAVRITEVVSLSSPPEK